MNTVVTSEMAEVVQNAEANMWRSRLIAVMTREDNPAGVHMREFGTATAYATKIPSVHFNTVRGLTAKDTGRLDDIIAFYDERAVACRFEITPLNADPALLKALSGRGFHHTQFHTNLIGTVANLPLDDGESSVVIRALGKDEFDTYAEIYLRGFGSGDNLDAVKPSFIANNIVLYGHDGWKFYVALVEGEPVGIAAMFVHNEIATMAVAATLPTARGQGVQTELIRYRIREAGRLGCSFVAGQAKFGSVSQNNLERCGLNIAYTKAIWERI